MENGKNLEEICINPEEVKKVVNRLGPHIEYDITRDCWFPEGRKDIAVIQRDAEDGFSYGRTVWYLAYNNGTGTQVIPLHDTGKIHDNCHTWSVKVEDDILKVRIGYGGYEPTLTKRLSELGIEDKKK